MRLVAVVCDLEMDGAVVGFRDYGFVSFSAPHAVSE